MFYKKLEKVVADVAEKSILSFLFRRQKYKIFSTWQAKSVNLSKKSSNPLFLAKKGSFLHQIHIIWKENSPEKSRQGSQKIGKSTPKNGGHHILFVQMACNVTFPQKKNFRGQPAPFATC